MLKLGLLAMAGMMAASRAEAAVFWSDSDPMVMSQPVESAQPRRQKRPRRAGAAKIVAHTKETARPQGPLVIAISIDRQILKVYDANGLYAETPVSTGMRGHSTPMGVFSVIQKDKFHRSNIYSDAPMPYMQRITWSGIAIHAGVLPGYPASHGCIRMPMAFAIKMWGWTRMGARVVIAPGELSPSELSHPLLTAQKPDLVPTPMAAAEPARAPATTAGLSAVDAKPPMSSASLELNPSVDDALAKAVAEATGARRDQTQTADASSAIGARSSRATLSDASSSRTSDNGAVVLAKPDAMDFDAKAAEFRAATDRLLDSNKDAAAAVPSIMVEKPAATAKPVEIKDDKPAAPKTASTDPAKDESQPDADQASPLKPEAAAAPKRSGPIAVLISKKDNKLYVRQNFAPLFDVPVTIAASDRPLGTHVFTARADKDDAKAFHWSVVSMPTVARRVEDNGATRRRKSTGAIDMTSAPLPDTAAEALDRIKIPDDAMIRISEALATSSSIIISDQGIAGGGETGLGTDFIVPLH
jgi:hypothetical protein